MSTRINQSDEFLHVSQLSSIGGNSRIDQTSELIHVLELKNPSQTTVRLNQSVALIHIPIITGTVLSGTFWDLSANPIANGTLTMELSEDAYSSVSNQLVCKGLTLSIKLDSTGSIPAGIIVVSNGSMTSFSGNEPFYRCKVFTNTGQFVWFEDVTIPTVSAYSFNSFTPPLNAGVQSGMQSV